MLEQERQFGDPGQWPGRQFEIMAVDLRRRLAGARARAGAVSPQGRHEPSSPPEDPIQKQTGIGEGRAQGFRQVAPAMALNGVELGEQRGQCRDADDQSAPRTHEHPQPGNRRTIIIEVLDHVQGQHGVTRCSNLAEGLSQVGLHQASARAVELLERPPGDIHAQNVIAAPLQGFQRDSPAAAGVENLAGG